MTPQEFPFPDEPIRLNVPDWFNIAAGLEAIAGVYDAAESVGSIFDPERFAAGLGITTDDFIGGTTIPNPIAVVAAGYRRATSSLAGMAIILALIAGAAYVAGKALS